MLSDTKDNNDTTAVISSTTNLLYQQHQPVSCVSCVCERLVSNIALQLSDRSLELILPVPVCQDCDEDIHSLLCHKMCW